MLLRDELEQLRMAAQKCQAKMDKENTIGRVLVPPELVLDLLAVYEQRLAEEAEESESRSHGRDRPREDSQELKDAEQEAWAPKHRRPFKW